MGFWPLVNRVMQEADIIVFVLDARMPELSHNKEIERKIEMSGKPVIYVMNKIDLLSEESTEKIKKEYNNIFFVSATKNIGIKELRRELHIIAGRMKIEEPCIGVVGYPNIGKSALINVLARRAKTQVADKPGTTRGVQWVKTGSFRILDTPGVIPYDDKASKLVLMGSKSSDKISSPEKVAVDIIKMFLDKNKSMLEERFKIETGNKKEDEILNEIGRKRGFLKKGGEVDETKTAIYIIQEWHKGRLKL